VNPLRASSQYFDEESGLHYNTARFYDPVIGRYITRDPIGHNGGFNLYAFARNDPQNYRDPRGLEWVEVECREVDIDLGVGGSIGVGAAASLVVKGKLCGCCEDADGEWRSMDFVQVGLEAKVEFYVGVDFEVGSFKGGTKVGPHVDFVRNFTIEKPCAASWSSVAVVKTDSVELGAQVQAALQFVFGIEEHVGAKFVLESRERYTARSYSWRINLLEIWYEKENYMAGPVKVPGQSDGNKRYIWGRTVISSGW